MLISTIASPAHRPKTLRLYINRQNAIGFDEAETVEPTQEIELKDSNYNTEGIVVINLRFVKLIFLNHLCIDILLQQPLVLVGHDPSDETSFYCTRRH